MTEAQANNLLGSPSSTTIIPRDILKFLGTRIGNIYKDTDNKFTDINNRINQLTSESGTDVDTLETELNNIKEVIRLYQESLGTELNTINNKFDILNTYINDLKNNSVSGIITSQKGNLFTEESTTKLYIDIYRGGIKINRNQENYGIYGEYRYCWKLEDKEILVNDNNVVKGIYNPTDEIPEGLYRTISRTVEHNIMCIQIGTEYIQEKTLIQLEIIRNSDDQIMTTQVITLMDITDVLNSHATNALLKLIQEENVILHPTVKTETKNISFDSEINSNYIVLSGLPIGDIISLIVEIDDETIVVDGIINRIDKRVEFLDTNLSGNQAIIKYLGN